ncbi:MAG: hypothetical protein JKY61_05475 [Planctomycetes bacterium]|nr:hypothetical protein [Planctomycetota bacterium]
MKTIILLLVAIALLGTFLSFGGAKEWILEPVALVQGAQSFGSQEALADEAQVSGVGLAQKDLAGQRRLAGGEETLDGSGTGPEVQVSVLVVDRAGRVQPMYPVHLCTRSASGRFARCVPGKGGVMRSDANGLARFSKGGNDVGGDDGPVFVVSGFAWQSDVFVELTVAQVEGEPAVLEVPIQGSAEIRLVGPDGKPWSEKASVYVDLGMHHRYGRRGPQRSYWIHALPLDRALRFCVDRHSYLPVEDRLKPAFTANQPHRKFQMVVGGEASHVIGRLIGDDGKVFSEQNCKVMLGAKRIPDLRTDEGGGFRLELGPTADNVLEFEVSQDGRWQDSFALVPIKGLGAAETLDLGSVQLLRRPFLVEGILSSEDGGPFANEVRVQGRRSDGSWVPLGADYTDNQGRFLIHGDSGYSLLRLTVHQSGFPVWKNDPILLREPMEIPVGSAGVIVRLEKAAYVTGKVEGKGDRELRIDFTYADGEVRSLTVHPKGGYNGALPPGLATANVIEVKGGNPILEISDVHLRIGFGASSFPSTLNLDGEASGLLGRAR